MSSRSLAAPAIIGGAVVDEKDPIAAMTVGILFKNAEGKKSYCSGTILDTSHVLSAAHCVQNAVSAKIVFKRLDLLSADQEEGPLTRTVLDMKAGAGYAGVGDDDRNMLAEYNDLSVLTFADGLPEGFQAAQYLKLAPEAWAKKVGSIGTVTVAGYGRENSQTPTAGSRPIQNLKKTEMKVIQFRQNLINFVTFATKTNTCRGDSGGPAFVKVDGDFYLVGVLSRSDCLNSSIFTRYIGEIDQ